MVQETIFSHWIFSQFLLPFLLVFFILFAVLEKTKIFGEKKGQLNALVSFVIGLIFVGAVFPKLVIENLILFLTVAIVVVFVILLIWGFITGGEAKFDSKALKIIAGIVAVIIVLIALVVALDWQSTIVDFLFRQEWSSSFWTNFWFIVIIAGAIALVLVKSKNESS